MIGKNGLACKMSSYQHYQEINRKKVQSGEHPFPRLESFTKVTKSRDFSTVFLTASVASMSAFDINNPYGDINYDVVDEELLQTCMPIWEIAEGNLRGNFHLFFEIDQKIITDPYEIKLSIHVDSQDDLDMIGMYMKLNGMQASMYKTYALT
jgi:hypothetical protein